MIKYQNFGVQKNWIANRYQGSSSTKYLSVISPYFGKEICTVPDSNIDDLNLAVDQAKQIFPKWSKMNIRDRAEVMFQFKFILEKNIEELAQLIALDNGKTIADAKGSIIVGIKGRGEIAPEINQCSLTLKINTLYQVFPTK